MRSRRAVVVTALLVALAGCSGSDDDGVISQPTGTPTATGPTTGGPAPSCAPAFPATTGVDTGAGAGEPLGMRSARGAAQPGYDRVVFELGGSGTPGWHVSYVDHPESDGSGNAVVVQGSFFLQVLVRNVGYPGDTGVPEPSIKRFSPIGTTVVRQVVLDQVFEGQYTSFIGLREKRPFRVTALAGPPRVVVDVRHC